MDDPKINDGGGLYDAEGLIDTLIVECNDAVKSVMGGNAIKFCAQMVEMVQKLDALKRGIQKEKEAKEAEADGRYDL